MTATVDTTAAPLRASVDTGHLRDYGALLGAIVCAFLVEGIAEPGRWELVFLTTLLGATVLLALRVAGARPRLVQVVVVVVVTTIAFSILQALVGLTDEEAARLAAALLVALAPPAVVVGVTRRLRATHTVPIDAVIGVLCIYLLLGMLYGSIYGVVDRFGSGAFFAAGQTASVAHCLYFSFTTLSTTGYGDFTAAANLGHTLAVSEAILGQVYLVTVVSLIIGNLGRRR
jgi:Ion channel